MKKLALPIATFSVLLAGAASAADIRMPVKAPPPVPVAIYSWTGCYVGAGGGYGMFDQDSQLRVTGGAALGFSNDNGGRGWFGTVQAGCDYQIGSNIVIGAFGDYDFGGIKGDMAVPFNGRVGEEKLKNSWAAGGRIGWVPFQASQLLVFVSGGYTQARFGQVDFRFASTGTPTGDSLVKHTYDGWFLGSGYEYGLGFLPGLFWKTEYRFADYGKESANVVTTAGGVPVGQSIESHKYVHTVRSELVWRFNWSGPAAAYAADVRALPVKAPAPVVTYNWTGCYVGAGGGYGMFNQEVGFRDDGVPSGLSNDIGGRGWFGTVQVGCDYQIGSNIVVGAFGDYDFSGIKGDWSSPAFSVVFGTSAGEEKLKNSWATGGRIGWLPFQQLQVYVSGGYTQAQFSQITLIGLVAPTGVVIPKHTYAGWFVGTGYEYGLGWFPGLSWKTEYRFADYGADSIFVQAGGVVTTDSVDQRKYVQTIRSELVWRFNFGGPVAARY